MRLLVLGLLLASCSSGSKTASVPDRPEPEPAEPADSGDRLDRCLMAQEFEVQAWLNHAVTQDDETETWATLGMVMTLTEPEILDEMGEADPEAGEALSSSRETWQACRGVIAINCASLDQAAELTEVRVGEDVWESSDLIERCAENQVDAEQADCVLAARDAKTAKSCLGDSPVALGL
jgi:hypothetical protein